MMWLRGQTVNPSLSNPRPAVEQGLSKCRHPDHWADAMGEVSKRGQRALPLLTNTGVVTGSLGDPC